MHECGLLIGSYILGAVPFGLIIVRLWRGIDIRSYGSGNIGATNVLRTVGPAPAAVVFAADIAKGLTPIVVGKQLFPGADWLVVVSGMLAILGHSVSIFLRLRGGKGVATGLGVLVGLDWRVACVGFGLWVVVVGLCRYVSMGSMIASACVPVLMWVLAVPPAYQAFAIAAGVFVIAKHHSNIARLIQGKEPRWREGAGVREG